MATSNVNAQSGPIWEDFFSIAQAKRWIGLPTGPDATLDPDLQLTVSAMCEWVQQQLGKPIAPTNFHYRFDGWSGLNGAYIELPYCPVLEIQSVVEWRGTSGPYDLDESTPDNQVDGWQCEWQTGRLIRIFPGLQTRPWFPGSRNIDVQWTAGYNPIPRMYQLGASELVKWWWINTQQNTAIAGPGSSMEDSYDQADNSSDSWDGMPDRVKGLFGIGMQVGIG